MNLQRIESAECPKCGCNDTEEIADGRYACNYCGETFVADSTDVDQLPIVNYVERRTPICPVHKVPMHSNGKPVEKTPLGGRSIYFNCPRPGCNRTGKGGERIV